MLTISQEVRLVCVRVRVRVRVRVCVCVCVCVLKKYMKDTGVKGHGRAQRQVRTMP